MSVVTGLDVLRREDFESLHKKAIGVVVNQATVSADLSHFLDLLTPLHSAGKLQIRAVFGPQHGLYGHTQDNMIEWEGSESSVRGWRIHSLNGATREPAPEMLEGIDELIIDLPDIGSRYYTFAWTMALCIRACEPLALPVTILDRPNPIGGIAVEGPVLDPYYRSFVGEYPAPIRHGMTLGELATYLCERYFPGAQLKVVKAEGWEPSWYFDQTGLPWVMPSPNMPTLDTAIVYSGGCLLEGTNLSEARGTTRPFEIFGAPFLDGYKLSEALNELDLPGCKFRPVQFQPTFNKHAGRLCGGCQVHVTNRDTFEPVLTYVAILQESIRQSGLHKPAGQDTGGRFSTNSEELDLPGFAWKLPPYEYVYDRQPIDILTGCDWLEPAISGLSPLNEIRDRMKAESETFAAQHKPKLYSNKF